MIDDRLIQAVRSREMILFVGSGVSKCLDLPSWSELIAEMARQLEFDPRVFNGYGDYLELAEFYQIRKVALGPLRSEMDRVWHTNESRVDLSRIHQAIVNLNFPIIYTTNYDRWIEIAFKRRDKGFVKIANVGDFANVRVSVPQIVKFHGDFDDDNSLVLTESSYFERLAFESPLDIKLRSDSIGRSILFIGYSLSDINIRYLLYKLHWLWANSGFAANRPKSFMFLARPNPVKQEILEARGIEPIVSDIDDPKAGLADFLERLDQESAGTSI